MAYTRKQRKNNCIDGILRLMNCHWEAIPLSENKALPEYLEIKNHRDVLEIKRIKPFR